MEICTMDKSMSHFYKGCGPTGSSASTNTSYETIGGDDYADSYSNNNNDNENVQYANDSSGWKVEDVECKQEMPTDPYNGNYSEPFQYGGYQNNSISPFYSNESSSTAAAVPSQRNPAMYQNSSSGSASNAAYSPYQMSTSAKSQLPAWYNPPHLPPPAPILPSSSHSRTSYYPSSTSFYPHHHPYQANYAATSSDHNMRNMIQMTNR